MIQSGNNYDRTIKKIENFQAILSAKLIMTLHQNKKIRRQHPCHCDKQFNNNAFFFSKIKMFKKQLYS